MDSLPDIYPLTGLQIGDIQAYVSHAFLYVAPLSKRLLVMVDNRPWLENKQSKSTRIWQMMVTKYRMSPFMNTRVAHKSHDIGSRCNSNDDHESYNDNTKKSYGWLRLMDSSKLQEKYFHAFMSLTNSLHGFIVFELAWKDVHGINYLNELQTDTSLALEVRTMKKWEFFDPEHASSCISLWFSESVFETQPLKDYLKKLTDIDLQNSSSQSQEVSSSDVPSEDEFSDVQESALGLEQTVDDGLCNKGSIEYKNVYNVDQTLCTLGSPKKKKSLTTIDAAGEAYISPTHYSDTLILCRFNDSLLPFKLKQIIMSDIRLLTLLESGLPSWVIFFQSYPLFCHFYRPWMRLLVRTLHVMVSLVTVIIGFYDLYKNVPLLKATAARLCGPLFDWIETWDMVTRLRYLGTIFFLQNLQKCFNWILLVARTTKSILAVISRPLFCPLIEVIDIIYPLWNAFANTFDVFTSTVWSMVESMYTVIVTFAGVFLWPFEIIYIYFRTTATLIYPILCCIWELFLLPVRCAITLTTCFLSLLSKTYYLLKDIWETISSTFEFSYLSETEQSSFDSSVLKELWNDLFSQVFRATRSILNGLVTFFISCNRHRLSLYNHLCVFVRHLARSINLTPHTCRRKEPHKLEHNNEEVHHECDRCK
ncbi:hypothetical protein Cni_G12432 [Canna indica]|uniref:Uncharacterized protein n=1 Tax=Canna indica TaxID=4628 RepID=A0AAQ3K7T2_9LILI|nr:hypothetical protein Cni_G12432 [Canna indica]